ncbi:MAG: hypothetical protein HC836_26200 [Richelia sp. RM2_1_2]|nr:hypothetical protein [Richelia sp. RM2_1_2]
MHPRYKVKYKILPSTSICNALEQNSAEINRKKIFYDELEKSILEQGFINPIMVNAGFCPTISKRYLPKHMVENKNEILVCCKWGGSRLYIAQKHQLDIPCLISDFIGKFVEPELDLATTQTMLYAIREIVVTDVGLWAKV